MFCVIPFTSYNLYLSILLNHIIQVENDITIQVITVFIHEHILKQLNTPVVQYIQTCSIHMHNTVQIYNTGYSTVVLNNLSVFRTDTSTVLQTYVSTAQ